MRLEGEISVRIIESQSLIESASWLTREELNRAKQSLQTTLDLGKSALSTIEARLKQRSE